MPNFNERLQNLYGGLDPEETQSSWIPKRKHFKDDLPGQLREKVSRSNELSSGSAERIIQDNILFTQAKADISASVTEFLKSEYGEPGLEQRMVNFQLSWDRLYEKYGDGLIVALAELTDYLDIDPFVNFAGFINKDIVKRQIKSLRDRADKLV